MLTRGSSPRRDQAGRSRTADVSTSVVSSSGGLRAIAEAILAATARRVRRCSAVPSPIAIVDRVRMPGRVMRCTSGSASPVATAASSSGRLTSAAWALPGSTVRGLHSMNCGLPSTRK
jgi:hypothetical protein